MIEVVVAGELYADLIMGGFDFWPQPGQEAFAREFRREIGGGAAITACGLATLGTATTLFGIAGGDSHVWIAERLAARGVDTALLRTDANEPTAFTVAVSAPHDRAFFTYLGVHLYYLGGQVGRRAEVLIKWLGVRAGERQSALIDGDLSDA